MKKKLEYMKFCQLRETEEKWICSCAAQEHSCQSQSGRGLGKGRRSAADGLWDVPPPVDEEEYSGREEEEEQENNWTRSRWPGRRGQAAGTAQRWETVGWRRRRGWSRFGVEEEGGNRQRKLKHREGQEMCWKLHNNQSFKHYYLSSSSRHRESFSPTWSRCGDLWRRPPHQELPRQHVPGSEEHPNPTPRGPDRLPAAEQPDRVLVHGGFCPTRLPR